VDCHSSTVPVPWITDIHAPDFSVNYLARTLNLELLPEGIRNILIRCGGIKTPSVARSEKELAVRLGKMAKEKSDIYKARLEKVLKDQVKFDSKRTEPIEVAKIDRKVLLVKNSKTRYQIGHMSKLGALA